MNSFESKISIRSMVPLVEGGCSPESFLRHVSPAVSSPVMAVYCPSFTSEPESTICHYDESPHAGNRATEPTGGVGGLRYIPPPYTYGHLYDYDSLPEVARQALVDNGVQPYNVHTKTPSMIDAMQSAHLRDFGNTHGFRQMQYELVMWRSKIGIFTDELSGTLDDSKHSLSRLSSAIDDLRNTILPNYYAAVNEYVAGYDAFVWLRLRQLDPSSPGFELVYNRIMDSRDADIGAAVRTLLFWAEILYQESLREDKEQQFRAISPVLVPGVKAPDAETDDLPPLPDDWYASRPSPTNPSPDSSGSEGSSTPGTTPNTPQTSFQTSTLDSPHDCGSNPSLSRPNSDASWVYVQDDAESHVKASLSIDVWLLVHIEHADCGTFPVPPSAPFWIQEFARGN
ncbi:hypothetical protein CC2G_012309 [Coprinopsis cinerea AmutBmut pab1-1]|nr:hypothetical protein CC2G_012309 [Coprinopsis cinerea AmutBmut pab1-1]